MDEQDFSFDLVDKDTPEVVIGEALKKIEEKTRGYVSGHIQEYRGPIASDIRKNRFTAALSTITDMEALSGNIQNDLGEQDEEDNGFEVFVSVKNLQFYKYRMMFVDYGAVSYPVTIMLDKDLAGEYRGKENEVFAVNSVKELRKMMNIILNSKVMFTLLQNLIYESMRQENKKDVD